VHNKERAQSSLSKLTTTMALPYSTTNHKDENENLLIRAIATIVSSFITVDCCLVSHFKDLVEIAPQWPW
jgi:hypothetical protein